MILFYELGGGGEAAVWPWFESLLDWLLYISLQSTDSKHKHNDKFIIH